MTELPSAPSPRDHVQAFIARIQRETGLPGIGVAVSIDGQRCVVTAGRRAIDRPEPIAEHARFQLGCITKLLMSAVALEHSHAGALDMNASIGEYLPELRGTLLGDTVTVCHLLSHTSGYRGINLFEPVALDCTWERLVNYLRASPRFFAAGTVFSYEHSEAVLLDAVLGRTAGNNGLALIREQVFEAIGIDPALDCGDAGDAQAGMHDIDRQRHCFKRVGWSDIPEAARLPFHPFWRAAFSDYTVSLPDLLCIGEALMHSEGVFSPATLASLQKPVVHLPRAVGGPLAELLPVGFGLGLARLPNGWHGANASSLGQCLGLRFAPHLRAVVVAGLNAATPHLRDIILGVLCRSLQPLARPDDAGLPLELPLRELAGHYLGPGRGRILASFDGRRLQCEIGGRTGSEALYAELALDAAGHPRLECAAPQLSLGFFREPTRDELGVMLGLSAFKRTAHASA